MELTRRECEVLALVAEGLSNKEIALELGISYSRVKNYLSGDGEIDPGIYAKLGVGNRTEAALWWHERRAVA